MDENPKRLEPTKDTLRELFLKSGNECAYPSCGHRIIDESGLYIGQLCHIEAAEPRGPRFNPGSSNDARRHKDNLMLMCYVHHKQTDDVRSHPVERLRAMKADHERRFTDVEVRLLGKSTREIIDERQTTPVFPSLSLARLLGDPSKHPDYEEVKREILERIDVLREVPRRTRQFLLILVERASKEPGEGVRVTVHEVINAIERSYGSTEEAEYDAFGHAKVLEKYKLGSLDTEDTASGLPEFYLYSMEQGWCMWADVRSFCVEASLRLWDVVVELRFDLLD